MLTCQLGLLSLLFVINNLSCVWLQQYHKLLAQQREERDQLSDELDDSENRDINALIQVRT